MQTRENNSEMKIEPYLDAANHTSAPFSIVQHAFVTNVAFWHYENITASFWRLYWNTIPGGILHCYGGQDIVMEKRKFYFIPAYYTISSDTEQPFDHVSIHFMLDDIFRADGSNVICVDDDDISRSLVEEYIRSWGLNDNKMRCDILAYTIVGYVLQKYQAILKLRKMPKNKHIFDCLNYISMHLGSNLDNNRLAKVAGLTRNSFVQLFSKIMEETPQTYVRRKRIEKACQLINTTTMTFKEISEKLGFANQYHFSRVFRKHEYLAPSWFRCNHQAFNDSFES